MMAQSKQTLDGAFRKLYDPGLPDPYVEWARYELNGGLEMGSIHAITERASTRIERSTRLIAVARRLIQLSLDRRTLDRKSPAVPSQSNVP